MIGKKIRLERIIDRNSGRTVIVPMDHGVTVGPIEGLANMQDTVTKVVNGGANAILMHKGIVRVGHRGTGKDVGLIVHLSGGTAITGTALAALAGWEWLEYGNETWLRGGTVELPDGSKIKRMLNGRFARINENGDTVEIPKAAINIGREFARTASQIFGLKK